MYVGHQIGDFSDQKLTWLAQLGVEHIVANTARDVQREDGTWDAAAIRGMLDRIASFGITVDVLNLGIEAQYYERTRFPDLWTGGPGRDQAIATLQQNIRAAGEAGVPALKYNTNIIGILRTGRKPGRGGAAYSHFDVSEWTDHSLTPLGKLSRQQLADNARYVLERLVPVAEEARVRLAAHPHDPPLPRPDGLRGIPSLMDTVEGIQEFLDLVPSPYNGLNFCQGTLAEGCKDPAVEVPEGIRHFVSQGKVFMVHFRNIKGGYLNFDEVYPDNGDVDFLACLRAYRDAGYQGILCPDHVPHSEVDPDGERQFSFCLGYMRGLLQAVESEGGAPPRR